MRRGAGTRDGDAGQPGKGRGQARIEKRDGDEDKLRGHPKRQQGADEAVPG